MLKWKVFYENFDGKSREKDLYFNLSRTEIIDMISKGEVDVDEMQEAAKKQDPKELFQFLIFLVSKSYGEKSEDGEFFHKSPHLLESFKSSAAYDPMIMDITTNTEKALKFFNGIFPKGLLEKAIKEVESMQEKETSQVIQIPQKNEKVKELEPVSKPAPLPLSDEEVKRVMDMIQSGQVRIEGVQNAVGNLSGNIGTV